jgi:hypothetical protein
LRFGNTSFEGDRRFDLGRALCQDLREMPPWAASAGGWVSVMARSSDGFV